MNELEECLKEFVKEMGKVMLPLLCSLDVDHFMTHICEPIQFTFQQLILFLNALDLKAHVPAHTSDFGLLYAKKCV